MTTARDSGVAGAASTEHLAEVFGILSDSTRIEMLRLLIANTEVACTTFEENFPISKSTISYHVKALRHAGLIRVRKEGKYYHYTLLRDEIATRLPFLLTLLGTPIATAPGTVQSPVA